MEQMTQEDKKELNNYRKGSRTPEAKAANAKWTRIKRKSDPVFRSKHQAIDSFNQAKKKALKHGCIIATDPKEIKAMKEFYSAVCLLNQKDGKCKWSVDHIVELSMGGPHTLSNLQCLSKSDNSKKSHRLNPRKGRKGVKATNTIQPPKVETRDAN